MQHVPYTFASGQRVRYRDILGVIDACFPDGIAHVRTAAGRLLAIPLVSLKPDDTPPAARNEARAWNRASASWPSSRTSR